MRVAEALALHGQFSQALTELEQLRPQLPAGDGELRFAWASDHASVLASLGRRASAVAVHREELDAALARGNLAHAAACAGFCATHLSYLCRVHEGVAMQRRGLELARQAGVEHGLMLVDEMGLAGNLGDIGCFGEALGIGERVIGELQAAGLTAWACNSANDRAVIFMRLGRIDLAQQLLAGDVAQAPPWVQAARGMVRARLAQWQGQPALPLLEAALSVLERGGVQMGDYPRHKISLETARATGPAQALAAAEPTERWADTHEHVALARYARMVAMEARLRLGRVDEAVRDARMLAQCSGVADEAFGFYLPELLGLMADAFAAGGHAGEAEHWTRRALDWIDLHARQHVPPLFEASFRQRNPIHRRLADRAAAAVTLR